MSGISFAAIPESTKTPNKRRLPSKMMISARNLEAMESDACIDITGVLDVVNHHQWYESEDSKRSNLPPGILPPPSPAPDLFMVQPLDNNGTLEPVARSLLSGMIATRHMRSRPCHPVQMWLLMCPSGKPSLAFYPCSFAKQIFRTHNVIDAWINSDYMALSLLPLHQITNMSTGVRKDLVVRSMKPQCDSYLVIHSNHVIEDALCLEFHTTVQRDSFQTLLGEMKDRAVESIENTQGRRSEERKTSESESMTSSARISVSQNLPLENLFTEASSEGEFYDREEILKTHSNRMSSSLHSRFSAFSKPSFPNQVFKKRTTLLNKQTSRNTQE